VQLVPQSKGMLVHTYLGPPSEPARVARDAVLVRTGDAGYVAQAESWRLGGISACEFRDPTDVVVTPWQPTNTDTGSYYLGMLLTGEGTLAQRSVDGRTSSVRLGPGRPVLYARSRPFRLALRGPYRYLVLELRTAVLGLDQRSLAAASGREELSTAPASQLLAGLLNALPEQLPGLSAPVRLQPADAITSLLCGGLSCVQGPPPATEGLFDDVLNWIEERLADPDLHPAGIAAAHHISTRYLHKVFSRQGVTVAGYVRARRLELVRRDLLDTTRAGEPVSSLARRRGIIDASYLSKAFRARYGVSPREYRAAAG